MKSCLLKKIKKQEKRGGGGYYTRSPPVAVLTSVVILSSAISVLSDLEHERRVCGYFCLLPMCFPMVPDNTTTVTSWNICNSKTKTSKLEKTDAVSLYTDLTS